MTMPCHEDGARLHERLSFHANTILISLLEPSIQRSPHMSVFIQGTGVINQNSHSFRVTSYPFPHPTADHAIKPLHP